MAAKRPNPAREKTERSKASVTSRSTGGAGFAFEDQVAAWLLLKMVRGEPLPGVESTTGTRLQFQTQALGWHLDDLLATCGALLDEQRLAISCKSNVQVSASGLPQDFVAAAWTQWSGRDAGPMHGDRDYLMLATRGHHPVFQHLWTDIKDWCASTDTAFAIARISRTASHRKVFSSIKRPGEKRRGAISDAEVVELIRHLLVVPLDFDLDPSKDRSVAIGQCREVLASGALDDAQALWNALVGEARAARLRHGTIELADLWRELRTRFALRDHPDFVSSWRALRSLSQERVNAVEVALPTGFRVERHDDSTKLVQSIAEHAVTVLYGDSGCGKSALVKANLDSKFADWEWVWFAPEDLEAALSETQQAKIGLMQALLRTLNATTRTKGLLIIDAAERLPSGLVRKSKQLLTDLGPGEMAEEARVWRVVVLAQTEAWESGRLQELIGATPTGTLELGPASIEEVKAALRSTAQLGWLAMHEDALAALTNLRALAWVMDAESHFQLKDKLALFSRTAIADRLWIHWTDGRPSLQRLLMRLGEREASEFERSVPLSQFDPGELQAFENRPATLPLRINLRNRMEFRHDLAAEWARFQRLKEIAHETDRWAALATNPLWAGALRMLGQFLLRERAGERTDWDAAFDALDSLGALSPLAADLLLDALCLDPLAESLLSERANLLFAERGARLNRLLRRFHHIATLPGAPVVNTDPSLSLYVEAIFRSPIVARWPAVIRFLTTHREGVARLLSPAVMALCDTWLTSTPIALASGRPMPYRKELAEIALASARVLQIEQGKGIVFLDGSERPFFAAAFSAAQDIPDGVAAWALEMGQRRPLREDVAAEIAQHHRQQAQEHAERLRTDPVYRERYETRRSCGIGLLPSYGELPPWPLGPVGRVERDFRACCTHTLALVPLMRARPEVAAELLLAVIIEDSPKEEYDRRPRLLEGFGLAHDDEGYPTAYWQSPFFSFLQIDPEIALSTVITLVEFCTDRWDDDMRHYADNVPRVDLVFDDMTVRTFRGDHNVLDWVHTSSLGAGQLFSALAALERWLCTALDRGIDVSPYLDRVLRTSGSAGFLGVVLNVGKYRTDLFRGPLRPLLASYELYIWDDYRVHEALSYRFDAAAWARRGEAMFQAAREWYSAPYRSTTLREIAARLVVSHSDIAEVVVRATERWERPSNDKAALELRILQAELDPRNYWPSPKISMGDPSALHFEPPESLRRDIEQFQDARRPALQALTLPFSCRKFLEGPAHLTLEQAAVLATALDSEPPDGEAPLTPDDWRLARLAAAATLSTRATEWLATQPTVRQRTRQVIQEALDTIGETPELVRDRPLQMRRSGLEYVAHAVVGEWVGPKGTTSASWSEALRVLTCGDQAATQTLMDLAYEQRVSLGEVWWRLLELALLWCALAYLAPRNDAPTAARQRWTRWLRWLRARSLSRPSTMRDHISPLRIAQRAARLERRRWVREWALERDRFGLPPDQRRSVGLDTLLVERVVHWLLREEPASAPHPDAAELMERQQLLKALLAFELWHTRVEDDEDSHDVLPSHLGYETLWAIARTVPDSSVESGAELWKAVFSLGSTGHYFIGAFIDQWINQVSHRYEASKFDPHWRAMIGFALNSPLWHSGRNWYYGEQLLCRLLLGSGFRLSLDQQPELQATVVRMRDLYELWAQEHLHREEGNIAHFCEFLSSKTGRPLRLDGLRWLHRAMQTQSRVGRWYRSSTSDAVIDFLDTTLSEEADKLSADREARDGLLALLALLVARQIPAALALQERARRTLGGDKS